MTFEEWRTKYNRLRCIADRVSAMRNDRARAACAAAGLDPCLLGIHPHNAMCGLANGRPWPDVDYSKVRLCVRLLSFQFAPYRIVDAWDKRVRGIVE